MERKLWEWILCKFRIFSVFRKHQSKVKFHNLTPQAGRAKILLCRSNRQTGAMYLLPLATLSKTELSTDLTSGATAILCNRGPRLCLVMGKVRQEEEGKRETGSERKHVHLKTVAGKLKAAPSEILLTQETSAWLLWAVHQCQVYQTKLGKKLPIQTTSFL